MQKITNQILKIKEIFELKTNDYGASWRLMRPISMNDQLLIKVKRLRTIQDPDYTSKVEESQEETFTALYNYAIMAIINLRKGYTDSVTEADKYDDIKSYQKVSDEIYSLLLKKNADYGQAWKDLSVETITDLIFQKVERAKSIIGNGYKTKASEGIEGSYMDIANYAVFALIHLDHRAYTDYIKKTYIDGNITNTERFDEEPTHTKEVDVSMEKYKNLNGTYELDEGHEFTAKADESLERYMNDTYSKERVKEFFEKTPLAEKPLDDCMVGYVPEKTLSELDAGTEEPYVFPDYLAQLATDEKVISDKIVDEKVISDKNVDENMDELYNILKENKYTASIYTLIITKFSFTKSENLIDIIKETTVNKFNKIGFSDLDESQKGDVYLLKSSDKKTAYIVIGEGENFMLYICKEGRFQRFYVDYSKKFNDAEILNQYICTEIGLVGSFFNPPRPAETEGVEYGNDLILRRTERSEKVKRCANAFENCDEYVGKTTTFNFDPEEYSGIVDHEDGLFSEYLGEFKSEVFNKDGFVHYAEFENGHYIVVIYDGESKYVVMRMNEDDDVLNVRTFFNSDMFLVHIENLKITYGLTEEINISHKNGGKTVALSDEEVSEYVDKEYKSNYIFRNPNLQNYFKQEPCMFNEDIVEVVKTADEIQYKEELNTYRNSLKFKMLMNIDDSFLTDIKK